MIPSMGKEAYRSLIEALRKRSIRCYFQSADHLVISRQNGPALPFAGNSFSVCHEPDGWYLWTWAPHVYRVPNSVILEDLCTEFVDRGESAQVEVPADLVERFSLVELSPEEWDMEPD
jgi:hypothetical protein